MFKDAIVKGVRGGAGRHMPTDTPEQITKAISKGIEAHGTRPHWFVRESLPEIKTILGQEIRKGLDRATQSSNSAMRVKDSELF